jgi:stage III sporulation protein AG
MYIFKGAKGIMDNSLGRFIGPILTKNGQGKRKRAEIMVIWIVIIAIIFLLTGNLFGKEEKTEKESLSGGEFAHNEYIKNTEERLTEVLKKVKGAGEVSAFITFESGGEKVVVTEQKMKREQDDTTDEKSSLSEAEEKVVLSDIDGDKIPYVTEERFPVPTGILIVAEGAENEGVRNKLYEAARAIFGLPAHRIKVTN